MDFCCGHLKTVGAKSLLRYSEVNTYLQCNANCNSGLSANLLEYRKGLIHRFGEEEAQAILDYCDTSTATAKWTWEELEEMRATYNARIRELTNRLDTY